MSVKLADSVTQLQLHLTNGWNSDADTVWQRVNSLAPTVNCPLWPAATPSSEL